MLMLFLIIQSMDLKSMVVFKTIHILKYIFPFGGVFHFFFYTNLGLKKSDKVKTAKKKIVFFLSIYLYNNAQG